MRQLWISILLPSTLLALGCQGVIVPGLEVSGPPVPSNQAPAPTNNQVGPRTDDPKVPPTEMACDDASALTSPTEFRRMSRNEYLNTLRRIFPAETMDVARLSIEAIAEPVTPLDVNLGVFNKELSQSGQILSRLTLANKIAEHVVSSPARLRAIGPDCLADSPDDACVRDFIEDLGGELLRRPMTPESMSTYMELWSIRDVGVETTQERLQVIIGALLNDPRFMFRVPDTRDQALTPQALAERISFASWGAAPDQALLDAAQAGELATYEQRAAQARRLLDTPQGRVHVRQLFSTWLHLEESPGLDTAAKAAGVEVDGLFDQLRGEALDFVEHVVFEEKGSYQDLLTRAIDFPRTQTLSWALGHREPTQGAVDSVTERAGLFARPGVMLHKNERPSPIHRGFFMTRRALCIPYAPPPEDACNTAIENLAMVDKNTLTSRELAIIATDSPSCSGCHNLFHPPGFALSSYGALGEYWEQEIVYGEGGEVLATLEVEDAVMLTLDGETREVRGASGLGAAIAGSEIGQRCAANQIFALTHLREARGEDRCHLEHLRELVRSGQPVFDVLVENAARETPRVPKENP